MKFHRHRWVRYSHVWELNVGLYWRVKCSCGAEGREVIAA